MTTGEKQALIYIISSVEEIDRVARKYRLKGSLSEVYQTAVEKIRYQESKELLENERQLKITKK